MKRFLCGLACLLLLAVPSYAGYYYSHVEVTAACDTLVDSNTDGGSDAAWGSSTDEGIATAFTTSEEYTCCKVEVQLWADVEAADDKVITAYLYSDDSDVPNALLATSTDTQSSGDISTAGAPGVFYAWNFDGQLLSNATKYWICLCINASVGDDYLHLNYHVDVGNQAVAFGDDCAGWVGIEHNEGAFKTYK